MSPAKAKDYLRWQLLWRIGIAVLLMWLLLAPWLLMSVQKEMQNTLDNRLAASAKMLMSLMSQYDLDPLVNGGQRNALFDPAENLDLPATLACKVANVAGDIIAVSHDAPENVLTTTQQGYQNRLQDGEPWRVFNLSQGGLTITTAERLETRDTLMRSVVIAAGLPFFLSLAGTLAVVWFGILHGFKPLHSLTQNMARRNTEDLTSLVWEQRPAEVRPLVDEINRLLQRMQQSLLRERRFTGDVAHELRTPLAGIKTQLQVARLTQGGKAMHALVQAEKATDRLQRTLDQLLLLARVEGDGQLAESTHLPVAEINNMALSDVQHLARQHQVTLRCNDGVDEKIHASAILLSAALRNLLENAIRHAPENSVVTLSVNLDKQQLCWTVEDDGPGVSEKLLTELTRRFVHGHHSDGSGLGLAIVDAIVRRFKGELNIENGNTNGLRVTIRIPLPSSLAENENNLG